MRTKDIPEEVVECMRLTQLTGTTFKVNHRLRADGSNCSDGKSKAMQITKVASGWVWFCHRCGLKGSCFDVDTATPEQTLKKVEERKTIKLQPMSDTIELPFDTVQIKALGPSGDPGLARAITWLYKNGIDNEALFKYFIGYSPRLERVIVPLVSTPITNPDHIVPELLGWLGRDVRERADKYKVPKVITKKRRGVERLLFHADAERIIPAGRPVVIVEDVFSAIKIQQTVNWDAIAVLGTYIGVKLMNRLGSKRPIVLWLDNDMKSKMIQYRVLLNRKGFDIKTVCSEKDPKKLTGSQIETALSIALKHGGFPHEKENQSELCTIS